MSPITLLDYGMGNLHSVAKALEKVGAQVVVTREPEEVRRADKLVVPGVGHFGACMTELNRLHLTEAIVEFLESGRPYLGICLGLQILFEMSEESPATPGLGFLKGEVVRFKGTKGASPKGASPKVPHMGWNQVLPQRSGTLLDDLPKNPFFYFVHSYHVVPQDSSLVAAVTEYPTSFVSAVSRENLFACQFHPEKSQQNGLRLFGRFVTISP